MKGLTPRQLRLAEFVAQGYSNLAIGELLEISPNTVRYHLKRIYARVGASSRVALARYVLLRDISKALPAFHETGRRPGQRRRAS